MANNNDPNTMHTMEEFISVGKSEAAMSYYQTSILDGGDNGILYAINNVLFDYIDELKEIREPVKLTPQQYSVYKYDGVNLLAYDIYGNRELAFIILAINGVYDPKDFDMNPLYLIKKDNLTKICNAIYNAEQDYLDWNNQKLGIRR